MPTPIPLSKPDIATADIDAVVEVLQSDTLSIGPKILEFEAACARIAGRRFAIGVSSGTAGLHCAMLAAGVGPGDEVVTTPFSFVASANCILFVDAMPVFVDIDPTTLNIDLSKVEAAITPATKAIVAVETFGHPGGIPALADFAESRGLTLIEDACEGFGGRADDRPIGSFGAASVFAFYPNKQITTGEGGMIVTDDPDFADACRAYRNQGRGGMAWLAHERLGYNYRLDELSAALGVSQVSRLDDILDRRRRVAAEYMRRLMGNPHLILPTLDDPDAMSWFVFVVRLSDQFVPGDRDLLIRALRAEGIGTNNYFPPIHLQPYMVERFGFALGQFPITEHVAARTLALPFFSAMTPAQVHRVCDVLEPLLDSILAGPNERF